MNARALQLVSAGLLLVGCGPRARALTVPESVGYVASVEEGPEGTQVSALQAIDDHLWLRFADDRRLLIGGFARDSIDPLVDPLTAPHAEVLSLAETCDPRLGVPVWASDGSKNIDPAGFPALTADWIGEACRRVPSAPLICRPCPAECETVEIHRASIAPRPPEVNLHSAAWIRPDLLVFGDVWASFLVRVEIDAERGLLSPVRLLGETEVDAPSSMVWTGSELVVASLQGKITWMNDAGVALSSVDGLGARFQVMGDADTRVFAFSMGGPPLEVTETGTVTVRDDLPDRIYGVHPLADDGLVLLLEDRVWISDTSGEMELPLPSALPPASQWSVFPFPVVKRAGGRLVLGFHEALFHLDLDAGVWEPAPWQSGAEVRTAVVYEGHPLVGGKTLDGVGTLSFLGAEPCVRAEGPPINVLISRPGDQRVIGATSAFIPNPEIFEILPY